MAISNEQGNIVEERLYDAWGLIKEVRDGQGNNLTKLTILDRGYTGHEHLQGVGLIHMNARLYDPVVHRFMGSDNYVVDPSNTQTYNRYGYVMNNPLKYTDPSGETYCTDSYGNKVSCNCNCGSELGNNGGMPSGQQQAAGNAAASLYNFFKDPENAAWASRNLKEAGNFIGRNAESVGGFFQSQYNSVSGWFKTKDVPNYSSLNQQTQLNYNSTFGGNQFGTYQGAVNGGWIDNFQTGLDVAGLVPGFGEIADGVNALIYVGRGDYVNAGLSATAMIPFAGWGATGAKLALKSGAKTGISVLGHYPSYTKLASELGARRFQIPTSVWNRMSKAEQWTANTKFLDRMILRGDNIRLATPINKVKPGSFYQDELNYLFEKGYKVSSDGLWLIK